jgi:hypothetical protein
MAFVPVIWLACICSGLLLEYSWSFNLVLEKTNTALVITFFTCSVHHFRTSKMTVKRNSILVIFTTYWSIKRSMWLAALASADERTYFPTSVGKLCLCHWRFSEKNNLHSELLLWFLILYCTNSQYDCELVFISFHFLLRWRVIN